MEKPSHDAYLAAQCCMVPQSKPILPVKTLDIINRRRYVRNTQYYFTTRKHAVKGNSLEKLIPCFQIPPSEKLLSYLRYSERKDKISQTHILKQHVYLKDNKRFAATRNLSNRLYVKDPPENVKSIVDIHPEFYSVIEGRPIRAADDVKVYLKNIRNYAMLKQQVGYRRDMIIQINKNITEESKIHKTVATNLSTHIHDFQKFLTDDYKLAQAKVAEVEKIAQELAMVNAELLSITPVLTILNNLIFKLDSIRNVLKMYRKYLLSVAPLSWREQFEDSQQFLEETMDEFYSSDIDLIEYFDIDKIVDLAKMELKKPNRPYMYFKYPVEMIFLFRTMELQSREYLVQLSKTNVPFNMLCERIKQLKKVTSQELDYFRYNIEYFNNAIFREQFNENHLQKKFYRILEEHFFDSVASSETLKLKICVEFVYEQFFGKCEEGFNNIKDAMRILEVTYEEYNLKLDSLDFNVVNAARNDNFAHDLKLMSNANKAQKELKAFRYMQKSMKMAFLPPAKFKRPIPSKFISRKQLTREHAEQTKIANENCKIKYKLKNDERDSLLFFTNWCEGTDPKPFLDEYNTNIKALFEL